LDSPGPGDDATNESAAGFAPDGRFGGAVKVPQARAAALEWRRRPKLMDSAGAPGRVSWFALLRSRRSRVAVVTVLATWGVLGCSLIAGVETIPDLGQQPDGSGLGDSTPEASADGGPDARAPDAPTHDSAKRPDAAADAAVDGDPGLCTKMTSAVNCETCCIGMYPQGYMTYLNAVVACECVSPATCFSQCETTLCKEADAEFTPACQECLNLSLGPPDAACTAPVSSNCSSDPSCLAVLADCLGLCPAS